MSVFLWQPSHSLASAPQRSSTIGIHSASLMHTGPTGERDHGDQLQEMHTHINFIRFSETLYRLCKHYLLAHPNSQ